MRLRAKNKRYRWLVVVLVLACVGIFVAWRLNFYSFSIQPQVVLSQESIMAEEASLDWPSYGQSAIAIQGLGVVEAHGQQAPYPTASTAKVITMLAVLEEKPLNLGESGPIITMTQADVDSYGNYIAQNGSNTPVRVGLQLTQYQAIQSVLLASSNNMADTLAIWAFGSIENYHAYVNNMVREIGATNTTIAGDASGLSSETTSTASDMAKIALKALENPVLSEIVAQSSAEVPYAGTIYNTNRLLGNTEIIGVKTGETVEAGGNFLLGARLEDGQQAQNVVVVTMGADLSPTAQADSFKLYNSAKPYLHYQELVKKNELVANYVSPWQETISARATESIWSWTWRGQVDTPVVDLQPVTSETDSINVGQVRINNTTSEVALEKSFNPPIRWKMLPVTF